MAMSKARSAPGREPSKPLLAAEGSQIRVFRPYPSVTGCYTRATDAPLALRIVTVAAEKSAPA